MLYKIVVATFIYAGRIHNLKAGDWMRHVPLGIFIVVALVGVFTLLFSVQHFNQPAPFAVQLFPSAEQRGDDTVVVRLDSGEALSNEVEAITGTLVDALSSGTVHAKSTRADYTQSMRFSEPGVFTGGVLTFGRDETNQVSDFLEFDDAIFKYQIDFSPGLQSEIEGSSLPDIEDEDLVMMGARFTIVDTSVSGNRVALRFFGGFGSVEFQDTYNDDLYTSGGVKINGRSIDARVKIKATQSGNTLSIYSIQYILNANAALGGDVQVLPLHCLREYLQYPTGLLNPEFDICYRGLTGAVVEPVRGLGGNEVRFNARGNDEYEVYASNFRGQLYQIPLAQLPGMYGNRGRNFVFIEAANPAAPNINPGDYFLVMSKLRSGTSNVLRYDQRQGNVVYFEDLGAGQRSATVDATTLEGDLLVGEGTYHFVIGAGDALAMDQNNDGNINGGEARWVLPGNSYMDFGPGFTVRVVSPSFLFDEPMGDETTNINILFGGDIDLAVPSPQATVPGYQFKMISAGGGIRQGLTKYGILFTLDEEDSSELDLIVPGAQARTVRGGAGSEVFITFERDRWMRQMEVPAAPPVCGDTFIIKPEYCDPPGSLCADPYFKRSGICSPDCLNCILPMCGNNLLEQGEECESNADCPQYSTCNGCKCQPLPEPVCGNMIIERGEQCERNADCASGHMCASCGCIPTPVVQTPAPAPTRPPNIFARFFAWLASVFGA